MSEKKLRTKVTIGFTPDGKRISKNVSASSREKLEIVKQACKEHYL